MATKTNEYGWSPRGFDPEKCQPGWKQFAIDACDFILDDAERLRIEEAALFAAADWWKPVLKRSTGFIKVSKPYQHALGLVIQDYTDYEETNGRGEEISLVSGLALSVLYDLVASDDIPG